MNETIAFPGTVRELLNWAAKQNAVQLCLILVDAENRIHVKHSAMTEERVVYMHHVFRQMIDRKDQ